MKNGNIFFDLIVEHSFSVMPGEMPSTTRNIRKVVN